MLLVNEDSDGSHCAYIETREGWVVPGTDSDSESLLLAFLHEGGSWMVEVTSKRKMEGFNLKLAPSPSFSHFDAMEGWGLCWKGLEMVSKVTGM